MELFISLPFLIQFLITLTHSSSLHLSSPPPYLSFSMLYAVSILYKTRLPFVLVFNKVDVVDHGFAVEWMTDFDTFQAALTEDTSYMGTLVNSMCLVLEEFYNHLRVKWWRGKED